MALATLVFTPAATAQQPPDSVGSVLPWFSVRPVYVTILRDSVELAGVPQSISVVRPDSRTRSLPSLALDRVLATVPGVQVDERGTEALGERISIRGFGARSQFGVRGVRVIVDGVPATMPDGQTSLSHVDPGTLDRAEVIRGAGSALWGNASGGVIVLETDNPPEVPTLTTSVSVGAFGLWKGVGEAGGNHGRLGWRARIAGVVSEGYREFSETSQVFATARLRHAGERTETRATVAFVDYDAQNPGSLPDSLAKADPRSAFPLNVARRTGERARQGQFGISLLRRIDGSDLELGAWGLARAVENPIPPRIVEVDRSAGGVRGLWRWGAAGSLQPRLTLGADLDAMRDDRRNFDNVDGRPGMRVLDQAETVVAVGPFAQLALGLGERIHVRAALRYDQVRFQVRDRISGPGDPDDSGRRTMDAISPSIGLSVDAGARSAVYALATSGFDTPTTTELVNRPDGSGGMNPDLEPQRSESFEVGTRARGERWSAEAALFRTRVRDALIPFQVPEQPGRDFFRNAGSAVHRGLEIGFEVAPAPGTALRLAYSWTDARFDEFRTEGEILDGRRVPGVAPHRMTVSFDRRLPAGWQLGLRSRYLSRVPVDDLNSGRTSAYVITDLLLDHEGFVTGGTRIVPSIGVTNLLDEAYTAAVTVNAFGARYFEPGPPRAGFVGFRLEWTGRSAGATERASARAST